MIVMFKCCCMPKEVQVQVSDRLEGEDVADWVQGVVAVAVSREHTRINAVCTATRMEYVKLPVDNEDKGIGFGATKQ